VAQESAKPKRRVVKKAETVREATQKSGDKKPKKRGILSLTLLYIGLPFRPVGRLLFRVGRLKPFRILGRILFPTYFRNSWKELQQVTWPGRRESLQLTLAVIIFSIVFGALIAVVDFGLDKVFKQVLLK
jgi:preprotein translocase SecE subunit